MLQLHAVPEQRAELQEQQLLSEQVTTDTVTAGQAQESQEMIMLHTEEVRVVDVLTLRYAWVGLMHATQMASSICDLLYDQLTRGVVVDVESFHHKSPSTSLTLMHLFTPVY